jgi:integrase
MALSDVKCRTEKAGEKLKKLSDGGGLQLWVTTTGSRLWRLAYRFGGKQKLLALGAYPAIGLADARQARDEARKLIARGIDPSDARKQRKAESADTFNAIADEWMGKLRREDRAPATMAKTEWLIDLARSDLGSKPIRDVLAVLRKVEARGRLETARRLRSTIGQVFRYAIATTRAENDPTIALRGALTSPTVKHRAVITDKKGFGALLRAVWSYEGQPETAAALKLMPLLFPRPGELRLAEWSEFDLEAATWTIPAARAKMRREHKKPLSRQAVAILRELQKLTGSGRLLLPSIRSQERPISENTLNAALRRLGYSQDEATAHGFRATASTLLNESGRWSADAIERELGHVEGNSIRRAYHRAAYWDERVSMMQSWADMIDAMRSQCRPAPPKEPAPRASHPDQKQEQFAPPS